MCCPESKKRCSNLEDQAVCIIEITSWRIHQMRPEPCLCCNYDLPDVAPKVLFWPFKDPERCNFEHISWLSASDPLQTFTKFSKRSEIY